MKLFKRNKRVGAERHFAWQDRSVTLLVNAIHKMQKGFAAFMHNKINRLSVKMVKAICIIFFFTMGCVSGYLILEGLNIDNKIYPLLRMKKIYFPKMDGGQPYEKIELPENRAGDRAARSGPSTTDSARR